MTDNPKPTTWDALTEAQRLKACERAGHSRRFADLPWLKIASWIRRDLSDAHVLNTGGKECITS